MVNQFYIRSKAKTFKKNIDWIEVFNWFNENIEMKPGDEFPLKTAKKYVITIKEVR